MVTFRCRLLLGALALVCSIPPLTLAAQGHGATISAAPGTLVRWTAPGTKRCSMKGRSWAALQGTCYYPVDLLQKPALITIALWGSGRKEFARISVEPYDYGTEEIDLPDIPQAHPSPEDLKRDSRDQVMLSKVWKGKEGPAQFTLPLGAPAKPLPPGKSFGVKRVFNGKPASQPHTGSDYATPLGTPVLGQRAVSSRWAVLATVCGYCYLELAYARLRMCSQDDFPSHASKLFLAAIRNLRCCSYLSDEGRLASSP